MYQVASHAKIIDSNCKFFNQIIISLETQRIMRKNSINIMVSSTWIQGIYFYKPSIT